MNCCSFNPQQPNHNRPGRQDTSPNPTVDDRRTGGLLPRTSRPTHGDDHTKTPKTKLVPQKQTRNATNTPGLLPSHVAFRPGCWDAHGLSSLLPSHVLQHADTPAPALDYPAAVMTAIMAQLQHWNTGNTRISSHVDPMLSFAHHFGCCGETPVGFISTPPLHLNQAREAGTSGLLLAPKDCLLQAPKPCFRLKFAKDLVYLGLVQSLKRGLDLYLS
jgi:hypothetical protein